MASHRPDVSKAGSTQVCFVCQKCAQPLKLDHSFANLDQHTYVDLTAPLLSTASHDGSVEISAPTEQKVEDTDSAVAIKYIPPAQCSASESANDFTLIGESIPVQSETLSVRLKVTGELFDILSGQAEVDHPLCEDCTDTLLDQLDQQLKITEEEGKDYRDFLEKLNSETSDEHEELALDKELAELDASEIQLVAQLESIESERTQLHEQMAKEEDKEQQLQEEEQQYFMEYNEYKRQLLEYEDAQRSVESQLKYAKTQLDSLKRTNVFNSTFHIWHSGPFGTINNFRLGRLPSVPVEWNEINAAWGQTVLLLHSLSAKMNLTFLRYRLVPYGNHSFVESLSDKSKELPLYGSGGFRFFWDAKFDQAMVAFLDCLQQFKEEVEKGNTGFCLPYKMDRGKIEDTGNGTAYSIKIQFNSEEQWTKALKFMLTNLKWGLAFVSSQFPSK
ncbi:hypothetical protein CAPTEDRAFT_124048 [Capitella teleta]|uniref:Beclin-1 n=1 Tax=Capitella teleta TaxID=283909 RepID=R7T955_CAPTE|nr:hypothetical protein CAPTEDRAFT_124048 [Capitella teleta]|eukprot:ELT90263.1 hypothetical protein CAPTEDRAFT_124048 [Capitella teleta]